MRNDTILSICCKFKENLSPDKYEALWEMAESLKTKVDNVSDFTMSWGQKDYKSQDLRFYLKRNIHISGYDIPEAKRIADIMLGKIKTVIADININESSVTSDFALVEGDSPNNEDLYHYNLSVVLPLK